MISSVVKEIDDQEKQISSLEGSSSTRRVNDPSNSRVKKSENSEKSTAVAKVKKEKKKSRKKGKRKKKAVRNFLDIANSTNPWNQFSEILKNAKVSSKVIFSDESRVKISAKTKEKIAVKEHDPLDWDLIDPPAINNIPHKNKFRGNQKFQYGKRRYKKNLN